MTINNKTVFINALRRFFWIRTQEGNIPSKFCLGKNNIF